MDKIVKRTRRLAKRHRKEPLVLIDVPDDNSLRGSSLQRTIRSFSRYLENILSWYGIYWEEMRLYSTICPKCGGKLNLEQKTKRIRIMKARDVGSEKIGITYRYTGQLTDSPPLEGARLAVHFVNK